MGQRRDDQPELTRLGELIDDLVQINDPARLFERKDLPAKVDFLERAIEAWRFHTRHRENKLSIDEFVQCTLFIDDRRIAVQAPNKLHDLGSGTSPIHLQPRLLVFLLLYHSERLPVFDIIERFIGKVRDQLKLLDFKKTRTGVTRCFTNTRFAAHTLRDYGLLKFTQREAYKTWVLSLPGFLTASRLLDAGVDWSLPPVERIENFDLHPRIRSAWTELKTYDDFVRQLSRICRPNVEVFSTFADVLQAAYRMLPGYWEAMNDPKRSQKDRKEETTRRLKALDKQPRMGDFYREFSACVNVEQLLKDID